MEDMALIIREEVDREDAFGETLSISSHARRYPKRYPHDVRAPAEDQTPRDLSDFSLPASWASEAYLPPSLWVTREISRTFFPYLGLRANGPAFSRSSLRSLPKISPPICLCGVMNVEVRNIEEEEAQGIVVAIDDPVPRGCVDGRRTTGCRSGQGMVSLTAPPYGRAGAAASPPYGLSGTSLAGALEVISGQTRTASPARTCRVGR